MTDTEKFRLRHFVEKLVQQGECVVHDDPIDLIDVAAVLDCNPRAVWFRAVGPEKAELVGNVMGTRRRLAAALDTDEPGFPTALRERLRHPVAPVEVPSAQAPVHEVVLTGDDADLTTLPVHLQHGLDGAPYISASIDYARDEKSGFTNIGCRRLMLRGPRAAGIDLNAPSDLRALYQAAVARGERMPVAFAVGSHPTDFLAAVAATAPMDELDVVGAVRGAPVPVVKCVTVDARVPADAELVLEGYIDERGLVEPEGPYGEYIGYYGLLKSNPVFHLTAITKRRDALFQTVTIGGARLTFTDTAQLGAAKTEAAIWNVLQHAVREPVAVCCTASSGGMYNVRVSLRQRNPGEARNAIAAVFCSSGDVKHVFVVDDDIDVFSDEQIDWALGPRAFRPTATSSWRRASVASRSIRRCKGAAPAPRPASTAPSRSARATAPSSLCHIHRKCCDVRARPSKPRWPKVPRPISNSWRRSAPATDARSCATSTSSTSRVGSSASRTAAMRSTEAREAQRAED